VVGIALLLTSKEAQEDLEAEAPTALLAERGRPPKARQAAMVALDLLRLTTAAAVAGRGRQRQTRLQALTLQALEAMGWRPS
jgi:hypothetical protein